jgi:hypothetical protein
MKMMAIHLVLLMDALWGSESVGEWVRLMVTRLAMLK